MANDKSKKIDKEYLLTDDSVNVYGFRLLTSGFQKYKYEPNPIGYRMHERKNGVVLRWADLRVDGDKVYGKPVINLAHPAGIQTADEIENGFLNAASVGHIVVLETSEAPDLMMEGQTGPTVTKWYCKEISLVDIPGNPNALIQLFDKDDKEINLTDFVQDALKKLPIPGINQIITNLKHDKMEFKQQVIKALNLSDNTSDDAVASALQNLVAKAAKVEGLTTAKETAEKALKDLKAETTKKEVTSILDKALDEKRITKELSDTLATDYSENPEGLKKLVDGMKAYKSVADSLADKDEAIPEIFKGKTFMELHAADLLDELKAKFPNLFDKLRKEHKEKAA